MEIDGGYTIGAAVRTRGGGTGAGASASPGDGAADAGRAAGAGVVNHIALDTFRALANDPAGLRREIDQAREQLTRDLDGLLRENGIDPDRPYRLRGSRDGGVEVFGDHPERERIEALIDQHPELTERFNGLSGRSSLLQAMGQASEFQRAYRGDARSAVAQYAGLFNAEPPQFNLAIEGGEGRGYFTRG